MTRGCFLSTIFSNCSSNICRSPTSVARGALSEQFDAVDCRQLPASVSYAWLRDEEWHPETHRDATITSTINSGDPQPVETKVASNPYDITDERLWVIDRMVVFLKQGEIHSGDMKYHEKTQIFSPLVSDPEISVKLVYFDADRFATHDSALKDDHNAEKKDNPLREGVKKWKELTIKLKRTELEQHGFAKKKDDAEVLRYHVEAQLFFKYNKEEQMRIGWVLIAPDGQRLMQSEESHAWSTDSSPWFEEREPAQDDSHLIGPEEDVVMEAEQQRGRRGRQRKRKDAMAEDESTPAESDDDKDSDYEESPKSLHQGMWLTY